MEKKPLILCLTNTVAANFTANCLLAMRVAVKVANGRGIPWVLDPVGVQMLSFRRLLALEFVGQHPAIVRGNHAEIDALGPVVCVTLATGEIDTIKQSNTSNTQTITGGMPMLQAVTATGCAQGGGLCGVSRAGTDPAGGLSFRVADNETGRRAGMGTGEGAGKLPNCACGCPMGVEL